MLNGKKKKKREKGKKYCMKNLLKRKILLTFHTVVERRGHEKSMNGSSERKREKEGREE